MQSILNKELDHPPQQRSTHPYCGGVSIRPPPSPFDESFLSFLVALFSLPKTLWDKYFPEPVVQEPPVPLNPNTQLFKDHMEALPPFANMSTEQRLNTPVVVSHPAWLTRKEETCQAIEAASMIFREPVWIESPLSSSFTALGYVLCNKDYEAFECRGPGRIMTIEFEGDLTTMSLLQTPLRSEFPLKFSVSKRHEDALVEWINSFVDTEEPDMVTTTGSNENDPRLLNAVLRSRASPRLISQPDVSTGGGRAVVMGAAREAKDSLERHGYDCWEPEKCDELRKQADRIAGRHNGPMPSIWSAVARLWTHTDL
jgi:hypothetical protein